MAQVTDTKIADENNVVHTLQGGEPRYRRTPCQECPWRRDNAGSFPAEAFRISAHTAYDGASEQFACHMSGTEKPATCAGFLLRNADHNIGTRLRAIAGVYDMRQVTEGCADLFDSYREMAEANGVDEDDYILDRCRANGY